MTLTSRHHALVVAIAGGVTTAPQLCKAVGLSSTSSVFHQLGVLERDGWITRARPGTAGTLTPAVGLFRDGHIARAIPIEHCDRCGLTLPVDHHHEDDLHTSMDWSRL